MSANVKLEISLFSPKLKKNDLYVDKKAAIAVIVALLMPVLIGFAALAIDGGFRMVQTIRLQSAANAAAIGTANFLHWSQDGMTDNALTQKATQIAQNAIGNAFVGSILVKAVQISNPNRVKITIDSEAKPFLAKSIGVDLLKVSVSATSLYGSTNGRGFLAIHMVESP